MVNNNIWANAYWNFFHTFSCNLNEKKINNDNLNLIHLFINNLVLSIPCEKCKVDTFLYFENNNFKNIKTKKNFIFFFYIFHNYVNNKLGKHRENVKIIDKYKNLNTTHYLSIINSTIYNNNIHKNVFKFFNMVTSD